MTLAEPCRVPSRQVIIQQAIFGFEALIERDLRRAARQWSCAIPADFDLFGILAEANAAMADLFLGQSSRAVSRLVPALTHWTALSDRLIRQETTLRASSSAQHVRVSARHRAAFAQAGSERVRLLCATITSLLRVHLACAQSDDTATAAIERLRSLLVTLFGSDSPDVRVLSASTLTEVALCTAPRLTRLRYLSTELPGSLRLELETAVAMAGLLPASLLLSARDLHDC